MGRLCDASSSNTTSKSAVTTQTTLNAGYGFSVVLGRKTEPTEKRWKGLWREASSYVA